MLRSMRPPLAAVRLMAAFCATLAVGAACTVVSPVLPAGSSFQVRVEDHGRPVSGVRVKLQGENWTKVTGTSERGIVRFANVPPGQYTISDEAGAGISDPVSIEVMASGPSNATIPLGWSEHRRLAVQALRGKLRWPTFRPGEPLAALRVELWDERTGRTLQTSRTRADGAFHLATPPPGPYVLRVTPEGRSAEAGHRDAASIPLAVDPRAAQPELDLEFGWTSCGVSYVSRHTCPASKLRRTSLRGQVLDASGASIPRATVLLFDSERRIAEQLTSDEAGRFASAKEFAGSYELVVSMEGFTTLRQPVQATRPQGEAPSAPLRIQLGVTGACSHAAEP